MEAVERVPVVQQVVGSIRDFILSGTIKVGEKLPTEKDLCAQLSVGRSTVREALRILQANGFVEIQPGRGAFVARNREPDPSDIVEWFAQNEVELKDCIEVRTALEPLAVKLAIARATDADIAQIARTHAKFVRAVEQNDTASTAKYDERFHNQIVESSRNKLLISINRKVSEGIQIFRGKTFQLQQSARNTVDSHTDIMRALEERDSEAGEMFMRRHIQRLLADMSAAIGK